MFGLCGFSKMRYRKSFLMTIILSLVFSLSTQGQTKQNKVAQSQKATIINNESMIYQDADFDAAVITTLKSGGVYDISIGKKGPFYKIRVKPGTIGYISESDLRVGIIKLKPKKELTGEEYKTKSKKQKSFEKARYRGPVLDMISYVEDTMGSLRNESLLFYGMKWSGYNTFFDGDVYTDANLLFHIGAPSYYESATTNTASGWVIIANFLFQTPLPQSRTHMIYYGFGPSYKYSHFNVSLKDSLISATPDNTDYTLDDMTLGAVFNLGLAFRLNKYDLRTDVKYYWETQRYTSIGASFQWEF